MINMRVHDAPHACVQTSRHRQPFGAVASFNVGQIHPTDGLHDKYLTKKASIFEIARSRQAARLGLIGRMVECNIDPWSADLHAAMESKSAVAFPRRSYNLPYIFVSRIWCFGRAIRRSLSRAASSCSLLQTATSLYTPPKAGSPQELINRVPTPYTSRWIRCSASTPYRCASSRFE